MGDSILGLGLLFGGQHQQATVYVEQQRWRSGWMETDESDDLKIDTICGLGTGGARKRCSKETRAHTGLSEMS